MAEQFDKAYWEQHWSPRIGTGVVEAEQARPDQHEPQPHDAHLPGSAPHPYLQRELTGLPVALALDAGCGTGSEALWLAAHGWQVAGVDISALAIDVAQQQAEAAGLGAVTEWIEADLMSWEPHRMWQLVTTSYAHPRQGHPAFYRRIAEWVAPGGTLLIVAHRASGGAAPAPSHTHTHPQDATSSPEAIVAALGPGWSVQTCGTNQRRVGTADRGVLLDDVIVRARREISR